MIDDDVGGDAAAGREGAGDGHALGGAGLHEIVEDLVGGRFIENALVSIRQQVILQRLQFDAAFVRRVLNDDLAEVGQARFGAHRSELGAANVNFVVALRAGIRESLECSVHVFDSLRGSRTTIPRF